MELLLGWSEYIITWVYEAHSRAWLLGLLWASPAPEISSFLPNPSSRSLHDQRWKSRIHDIMPFLGLRVFEGRDYSPSVCCCTLATKDRYLSAFFPDGKSVSALPFLPPSCLPPFLPRFLLMLEIKPRVLCMSGKCFTVELYLQFLFFLT